MNETRLARSSAYLFGGWGHGTDGAFAGFRMAWLFLAFLMLGAMPGPTHAQTAHPTQFCYQQGSDLSSGTITEVCSDIQKDAEVSMRGDARFLGSGQFLERFDPPGSFAAVSRNVPVASFWYHVKNRQPTVSYIQYAADLGGAAGSGGFGCTPLAQDPDAAYSDWCDSEPNMIVAAQQRLLATDLASCTITATTLTVDNSAQAPSQVERDGNNPAHGFARLGLGYGAQYRTYRTDASCGGANPGPRSITWNMKRHRTFTCQSSFYAGIWAAAAPTDGTYCVTAHSVVNQKPETVSIITGPVKQCASCAGSPNPIYPATGDKGRQEPDFEFAGRPFVRYYHSLGQLRNNPAFAVNWTHTYSDRIDGVPVAPSVVVMDDQGYLESYVSIGSNRFRGENSVDRFLYSVSDGAVAWRLRMAGGEMREFDAQGRLIAIRSPEDAGNDVVLAYDASGLLVTVTDLRGRQLKFLYANQMLNRIVEPDGAVVDYSYDADRNLVSVAYGSDRPRVGYTLYSTRQYVYHEAGYADAKFANHLTSIIDEAGQTIGRFSYDAQGRATVSRMLGSPNEVSMATYPSATQATMVTASGATRQYTLDTDLYRHVTATSDPAGSAGATYDSATGRLTSRVDPLNVATNYEYDATYGYRSATIEAVGKPEQRRTEFVRDMVINRPSEQRVRDATNTLKAKVSWSYINDANDPGNLGRLASMTLTDPSVTPNETRTTTYAYCSQADVTNATCPFVGLLKSVDGPRTDVTDLTVYTYRMSDDPACVAPPDPCPYRKGDLWKITVASGQPGQAVTQITMRDPAGRVLQVIDPNGVVTDFEYGPRGWLAASKVRGANDTTETDDLIARVEYWPTGQIKMETRPDGATASFTYDVAHRLTQVTDAYAQSAIYTLDAAGHRIHEETGGGALGFIPVKKLSRTFDSLGRLQSTKDAYSSTPVYTYTYDAAGNPDQTTDALGRVQDDNYDPLGRLSRTLQDMNGIAAETKFSYDVLDNLVQVNDPKLLNTNYTYSGFSDLKQLVSPDTGTTTYLYDSAGNRTRQTDARSKVANYAYDALNRLTAITYPGASTLNVTYTWDVAQPDCVAGETFSVGRLSKMVDGSGSTVYCYDRFGHPVRKVQTVNGVALTLRYTWDAAGLLSSTIYPDGAVVDYLYDGAGRVYEIGAKTATGTRQVLLSTFGFYPFGPANQWRYGDTRVLFRTLNLNFQPGIVQDSEPDGLSVGYEFDTMGNLVKLRDGNQSEPPKRTYTYDGLDRLLQTKNGNTGAVLQAYTYDKTGNRTSATVSGSTTTYSYPTTNHRLSSVGSSTRAYDFNGNTTSYPSGSFTKTFVYGDHNRMTQYLEGATTKMNYVYNGRGEQVRKYVGTTNTYSLYDESGNWLGAYGNAGSTAPVQQVIWFEGMPVGVFAGSGATQKLLYVQPDALGSPRSIIDPTRSASGTVIWKWNLDGEAFGNAAPLQDPDGDGTQFVFDLRFPGQRYDSASGLNYNYFRDYDPVTGRYIQSDPLGLLVDVNTYGYVRGNSLRLADSLGLQVDINLFSPGFFGFFADPLYQSAQRVQNRPGEISIGGHGLPGEVWGANGKPISIDDLASMIRATEKWKKGVRKIRLYVCDSGEGRLRHQLARELGADATIIAASDWVWYWRNGNEPSIYGIKEVGGNAIMDATKPGFWNWTTTNRGYGKCDSGCY